MCSSATSLLLTVGFRQTLTSPFSPLPRWAFDCRQSHHLKEIRNWGCSRRRSILIVSAVDENSSRISMLLEESDENFGRSVVVEDSSGSHGEQSSFVLSSNEGQSCDSDSHVYPLADVDLSLRKERLEARKEALGMSAHRFSNIVPSKPKRKRIRPGILINLGLMAFLVPFLLFFDWCAWKIVRLPLEPFYLTHPFLVSAVLSTCAGFLYVPMIDNMRVHQILRKEGPSTHTSKRGTPTMGGLFFIPVGIIVAKHVAGLSSVQFYGAALATLAFAAIGLMDDALSCVKSHNYGLPGWIKLLLQVAVGAVFSLWLNSTNISTPYNMKLLVPLPQPFGLVHLGKSYLILTAFCFASMGNGVNLTDGLDGLAGGAAALAFIGMSVAVLAICPELAVFGASMAGACIGFLFHNRYKASIFMGDTGSLALGGALAAMAACTGMFFPLFISSGLFVMEVLSVIVQVFVMKITRRIYGVTRRFFRMAPVHHHFELCGFREPIIVASAYAISFAFALIAGYIGLISA
ncbi:phospho-N-acetylmuramoyl-pentapeptide-transferase homolog [Dioscorea cayenensis subsp. rotundata]|uniref:Phospho-N-acetylmuramoyl-pentapeptide- transferase homolog n=1 Tax=Dioscorea cayennensis subsp. rotundata TaxID=55577 RepID=A0AB40AZN6_DIOCR|nr:phospho-N-acetylmuramoyl-pentapeptide-transferase homolog [Dioscorea cayenensis subsp. rotundata]